MVSEQVSQLLRPDAASAVEVAEGIWATAGTANAFRVVGDTAAAIVDTGLPHEARRFKRLLSEVADVPDDHLVVTHAHEDHIGGFRTFLETTTQIVGHRACLARSRQYDALRRVRNRRAYVLWGAVMGADPDTAPPVPPFDLHLDIVVDDELELVVGGRPTTLLHTPGAEGPDGLTMWVPDCRAALIGDLWGPVPDAFPNLFTLRGEPYRDPRSYVDSLDRILALEPELLLPGHFDPMRGNDRITTSLTRVRDAVRYVHDRVVDGMNDGTDLWTMMRDITLPAELELDETYGRVAWGVRAIYESLLGWFRFESTTELYDVPVSAVATDLTELAGGAAALAGRGRARLDADRPLEALHLAELGLAAEPDDPACRDLRLAALGTIRATVGSRNFQEAGWLASEIARHTDWSD